MELKLLTFKAPYSELQQSTQEEVNRAYREMMAGLEEQAKTIPPKDLHLFEVVTWTENLTFYGQLRLRSQASIDKRMEAMNDHEEIPL